MAQEKIKSPIITVAGHVDHGKTSILDCIRKTNVYETESGGITQKISFTKVPLEELSKRFQRINELKNKLDFHGFLFIDTPGHAAFSHLRKRGGSLADLAILVIDINEGIMPQTQEVLEILKMNKTPFVIALNKIDNISGWRKQSENMKENIELQPINVKNQFDEKLYTIIAALQHRGFNAKPFYEITDFSKELALIPCSAKREEGIEDLVLMLCGLSQKYLKEILKLNKEPKGIILEIKKEKTMEYAEAIIHDGTLNSEDEIVIASFNEPIITKIRVLEEILPLSSKFKPVKETTAANGIRMQLIDSQGVLPGMPFTILNKNIEKVKQEFKKEIGEKIKTDKKGIVIKADSLGSLEALITMLKQEKIQIISAGIGKINKKDIITAEANFKEDPLNAIILGFNVEEDEESKELAKNKLRIIKNDVIYRLIEDLLKFQKEKTDEILRDRMMNLAIICKIKILHQYIFRNSNPAVFGVSVEAGKIKPGIRLIDDEGKVIGKIKSIQENQNQIEEAELGKQVAISIPGIMFDRQLKDKECLYSEISENQFREFKKNKDLLTKEEANVLQKISQMKRKEKISWGM